MSLTKSTTNPNEIKKSGKSRIMQHTLLITAAFAVLLALAVFLIWRIFEQSNKTELKRPLFQYILNDRYDFDSDAVIRATDDGYAVYSGDDSQVLLESSPLYDAEKNTFYLTEDALWIDSMTGTAYKLPALSEISQNEDQYIILRDQDGNETHLDCGFIVIGLETYIFLEETKLSVDGLDQQLDPLAFCSSEYDTFRVYNRTSDDFSIDYEGADKITASCAMGTEVDLVEGIYTDAKDQIHLIMASADMGADISTK